MKAVIFLGPTLPVDEARTILEATYLPPAGQADVLGAATGLRPDVIGIVDGVFLQTLSIWHKEILYALDLGILVFGASSMGALRAAETAEFGAIGVGEIYQRYADGELDDDEVALAHGSAEDGYRKMSEPMVNVRATVAAAECAGLVDAAAGERLNQAAKSIYFADRTLPALLEAARQQGLDAEVLRDFEQFFKTHYVDQKRADALLLLQCIRTLADDPLALERERAHQAEARVAFERTTLFNTLYTRDRPIWHEETRLPLDAIANYASLHVEDFGELNFAALNRGVALQLGRILGLEATPEQTQRERARFRRKWHIEDDDAFEAWLHTNHLSDGEFDELMAEVAVCRRLHRWLIMGRWSERTTKLVLNELRLRDRYQDAVQGAAAMERLLQHESNAEADWSVASLDDLVADQRAWTEWDIDADVETWAEEAGFHSSGNLRRELRRAASARSALLQVLAADGGPDLAGA